MTSNSIAASSLSFVRIPAKTFLLGEYVALVGGPSWVVAHGPVFLFHRNSTQPQGKENLPVEFSRRSPAAAFLLQICSKEAQEKIVDADRSTEAVVCVRDWWWQVPAELSGGFGKSTAEFLLVWILAKAMTWNSDLVLRGELSWEQVQDCWRDFRAVNQAVTGAQPSGLDLVAQAWGGSNWWSWKANQLCAANAGSQFQSMELGKDLELSTATRPLATNVFSSWKDWQFSLWATGRKTPSHQHLAGLRDAISDDLVEVSKNAQRVWWQGQKLEFLAVAKEFSQKLSDLGWVDPAVSEFLSVLRSKRGFGVHFFAKGCGAMGSDVVWTLSENSFSQEVEGLARSQGWTKVGDPRASEPGASWS